MSHHIFLHHPPQLSLITFNSFSSFVCHPIANSDVKMKFVLLIALSVHLCAAKFFINPYPKFETHNGNNPEEFTADDALFITPLLESGKNVKEIQRMAMVDGVDELKPFPGYSGFFTVNKTYNSNLFFWYFPAQVDPANAPVLLWLQGKFLHFY